MDRRTILKAAAIGGIVASAPAEVRSLLYAQDSPAPAIHTVLLVTKCHLDVGFTRTQAQVMRQYFGLYFPQAMKIASVLRQADGDRYTWTTGSWLLYEYLEQAAPQERRAMEAAIAAGDIAWHALPFSWQTEMLDRSMIAGSLGFSADLDRRFGKKTFGAKMTDVPGHTRGIIAPLSAAGIRMLDVGVNAASTPPDVPDVFLWKDSSGNSLAMLYHRHDYGSVIEIPGSGVAVDVEVRGDNSGPHTLAEIASIYGKLRALYPGAVIKASNLSEVATAVDRVRTHLPVVTGEIGDTWIYGCTSDPVKVARFRASARLRRTWIGAGRFAAGDETDRNLLRRLALAAEHTWGTDTKTYLDNQHYRPADLEKALGEPNYILVETSWKEKRNDIDLGLRCLHTDLQAEAATEFALLGAAAPLTVGLKKAMLEQPIETRHFTVRFDASTGAIQGLLARGTGREWASPAHPLALFSYQTLDEAEYTAFMRRYLKTDADWAPRDFGKPGMDAFGVKARTWHPQLNALWAGRDEAGPAAGHRIVAEFSIDDQAAAAGGNVAWPRRLALEISLPDAEVRLDLRLLSLGKPENRLPEAMWLTFAPSGAAPDGWSLEKAGETMSPLDVVRGGGRAMHAVSGPVRCRGSAGSGLSIESIDAPVVALGLRSPLNFSLEQPDLSGGVHFSLFNNAWGTNYPQWCGGDWSYRFTIRV